MLHTGSCRQSFGSGTRRSTTTTSTSQLLPQVAQLQSKMAQESAESPRRVFPPPDGQLRGHKTTDNPTEATREEMRDAKVPLHYRDSCAHLLIPLNRCRYETYFLPWKCEVRTASHEPYPTTPRDRPADWTNPAGRETQLREVPIRRVQEARRQDERAEGSQGRCSQQLRRERGSSGHKWARKASPCTYPGMAMEAGSSRRKYTAPSI